MASSLLWSAFKKLFALPAFASGLMILLSVIFARRAWKTLPVKFEKPRSDIRAVGFIILVFGLIDWLLISSLPHLNISYAPLATTLFLVLLARLAAFICLGMVWDIGRRFWLAFLSLRGIRTGIILLILFNLFILAGELDALVIEPFRLQVTEIALPTPRITFDKTLRILHITDIHVERETSRELHMLALARELKPDLILLTGDYVNLDFRGDLHTWQDTRSILDQLDAPLGVYAVSGTPAVDTSENLLFLFSNSNIHLLQDEVQKLDIRGQEIYLLGISNLELSRDSYALMNLVSQVPEEAYSVLLYHTPDMIETASRSGIDLYLSGHTHGGQVRLPFYGALITFSIYGKKYESGLYQYGSTTLLVNRGVGLEGMGLPRGRFLCPPEIALIEVGINER